MTLIGHGLLTIANNTIEIRLSLCVCVCVCVPVCPYVYAQDNQVNTVEENVIHCLNGMHATTMITMG